jgi:hypothetical protein
MNAVTAAKAVLAKCAANDPWFPQPSQATVLAWAEQVEFTNLTVEDLLAGVTDVYRTRGNGFKPLPADVIGAARALRQEAAMREPGHVSTQRELTNAAKLAREVLALAETKTIPDDDLKFRRPTFNPLRVACTYCHAPVSRPCVSTATRQPLRLGQRYHPARLEAAAAAETSRRQYDVSVALADRQCHCGRPILNNTNACDRCTPIVNGPQQQPNGTVEEIQQRLGGWNLGCNCDLDQPCHADVLLQLANQ